MRVFGLILDSLGSTELAFILVVALIFFGPRKLPQLARSLGKSLAEFRKASEDFKRTWEREVALESARLEATENSIMASNPNETDISTETTEHQPVEAVPPDFVIARQNQPAPIEAIQDTKNTGEATSVEPLRKQDWL